MHDFEYKDNNDRRHKFPKLCKEHDQYWQTIKKTNFRQCDSFFRHTQMNCEN